MCYNMNIEETKLDRGDIDKKLGGLTATEIRVKNGRRPNFFTETPDSNVKVLDLRTETEAVPLKSLLQAPF